jgi:hypothetical protein
VPSAAKELRTASNWSKIKNLLFLDFHFPLSTIGSVINSHPKLVVPRATAQHGVLNREN